MAENMGQGSAKQRKRRRHPMWDNKKQKKRQLLKEQTEKQKKGRRTKKKRFQSQQERFDQTSSMRCVRRATAAERGKKWCEKRKTKKEVLMQDRTRTGPFLASRTLWKRSISKAAKSGLTHRKQWPVRKTIRAVQECKDHSTVTSIRHQN